METLDHYVQEAAAALALIRIDESVVRKLSQLKQSSARFRSPLLYPWQAVHQDARPSISRLPSQRCR